MELQRRRAELQQRLSSKAARRLDLLGQGRADQASQLELSELVSELDRTEREIRRRSPEYAALATPTLLEVDATTALLAEDSDGKTLLLEYFLTEENSYLWVTDARSKTRPLEAHVLPARETINRLALRAFSELASVDPGSRDAESAVQRELGRVLLGPVASRLQGRRLAFVTDGSLNYLPMAALPYPDSDPSEPLISRHEIVHLPSASALAAQRRLGTRRPTATRRLAVLADPIFSAADPRLPTGTHTPGTSPLDRLPFTRDEALSISQLAGPEPARTALGFEATRDLLLSGELVDFQILHFATHGSINASEPHLSGIMLSRFDRTGREIPSFLGLRDVYRLKLTTELVVLSGCRTALGRHVAGEGLVGLTRGFMYAGVPRVVASLWRVEDRATAALMEQFYRAMLHEGLAPTAALRSAQLAIRATPGWEDPYYWSGFLLQGDWLPMAGALGPDDTRDEIAAALTTGRERVRIEVRPEEERLENRTEDQIRGASKHPHLSRDGGSE